MENAGVETVDELRKLSTGTLRLSFVHAKNVLSPGIKNSPTLDFMYAPVIDGGLVRDHLVNSVREGLVRPNTPISWSYAKDDAWKFTLEAWEFVRDVKLSDSSAAIQQEETETGFSVPGVYVDQYFDREYPNFSEELKSTFPCAEGADCLESFARFVQE